MRRSTARSAGCVLLVCALLIGCTAALSLDESKDELAAREALAQSIYQRARAAYSEMEYDGVVEILTGYDERFPEQRSYVPNALFMLYTSHLALQNLPEAEAVRATMGERGFFPVRDPEPKASLEGARTEVYKIVGDVELAIHIFERATGRDPALSVDPPPRPAIVFFFGGGWSSGSVLQFVPHCRRLAAMGLVAMVADYRVRSRHGTTPFACVEDGKSAVRWIRANAERLNVDPGRIAAAGGSAGGHVAAATATVQGMEGEGEDLSISSVPNALVLFNPVYDNGPEGFGHARVKDRWEEFSPLHNIREGMPPAIVLLGTEDALVPVATAKAFRERMMAVGSRSELRLYPGQAHGFFNSPAFREGASRLQYDLTFMDMLQFLTRLGFC